MYCSNCGNKINDQASFCPLCGAPTANKAAAQRQQAYRSRSTADSRQAPPRQTPPRQGSPRQAPPRQPQNGQDAFSAFLNGSRPMPAMPLISLILFFVYATSTIFVFNFSNWLSAIFAAGTVAMFAISYFKASNKRLFFLIGCAIMVLDATIAIFSRFWFNIVFGLLLLGCVGAIAVYYAFEGRIITEQIKMFACFGLIFFGMLRVLFGYVHFFFPLMLMFFIYMIPYVSFGLAFFFYSPYRPRRR